LFRLRTHLLFSILKVFIEESTPKRLFLPLSDREWKNSNFKTDNFAKKQQIRNLFVIGSYIPSLSLVQGTS
jgi:hypothetical protein